MGCLVQLEDQSFPEVLGVDSVDDQHIKAVLIRYQSSGSLHLDQFLVLFELVGVPVPVVLLYVLVSSLLLGLLPGLLLRLSLEPLPLLVLFYEVIPSEAGSRLSLLLHYTLMRL